MDLDVGVVVELMSMFCKYHKTISFVIVESSFVQAARTSFRTPPKLRSLLAVQNYVGFAEIENQVAHFYTPLELTAKISTLSIEEEIG